MSYSSSQWDINERTNPSCVHRQISSNMYRYRISRRSRSPIFHIFHRRPSNSLSNTISLRRTKHIAPKILERSSLRLFDGSLLPGFPFSRLQFLSHEHEGKRRCFSLLTLPDVPKPPSSVTKISCTVQQEEFFSRCDSWPVCYDY